MPKKKSSSSLETADQRIDSASFHWQGSTAMEGSLVSPGEPGEFQNCPQVLRDLDNQALKQVVSRVTLPVNREEREEIEQILDDVRLRFFFGGQAVLYVASDRGPVVISAANSPDELCFSIPELNELGHRDMTLAFPAPVDLEKEEDLPFFLADDSWQTTTAK